MIQIKMAMQKISPLISPIELTSLISNENLVLIDARTGPGIKEKYNEQHLKGALFVDLEKDLSEKKDPANGGRHPLPAVKNFAALLGQLGIDKSSHVVVYDDKNGANAAARFWWMMRAVSHEKKFRCSMADYRLHKMQACGLLTKLQKQKQDRLILRMNGYYRLLISIPSQTQCRTRITKWSM